MADIDRKGDGRIKAWICDSLGGVRGIASGLSIASDPEGSTGDAGRGIHGLQPVSQVRDMGLASAPATTDTRRGGKKFALIIHRDWLICSHPE